MFFNVHDIFYSLNYHQQVSGSLPAIFRAILLLKGYGRTNLLDCVTIT